MSTSLEAANEDGVNTVGECVYWGGGRGRGKGGERRGKGEKGKGGGSAVSVCEIVFV